jgi:hypothetical protein
MRSIIEFLFIKPTNKNSEKLNHCFFVFYFLFSMKFLWIQLDSEISVMIVKVFWS